MKSPEPSSNKSKKRQLYYTLYRFGTIFWTEARKWKKRKQELELQNQSDKLLIAEIITRSNACLYLMTNKMQHTEFIWPVLYSDFWWAYWYMYLERGSNESAGEPTVRQTHQQKLWLYLAAFQCQTTKQNYKIIR